ncbi:3D domain-containing protein [Acetobacter sp. UBA5411]|uniref:3D domain-containing protein n=1 Tax=Acetobacter sp. UBA5411 TaxID=1945905 RepID=UPI0025C5B97E|nr:3D domain-containing protein [Acetobacter sp. UBA5411]
MRPLERYLTFAFIAGILLPACVRADDFNNLPFKTTEKALRLYATRYYVHYVESSTAADAAPLLRRDGSLIGISIPKSQFCFGALQGTIAVHDRTKSAIYNADGLAPRRSATCFFAALCPSVNDALSLQAWAGVSGNGIFGLGVKGFRLVPFRTVAVDPTKIPIGTVLYIPRLAGFAFDDKGTRRKHDGYVIAGDVGGGIKGNHIDLFTGSYTGAPPAFVTSSPTGVFDAYVVTDATIVEKLTSDAKYRP